MSLRQAIYRMFYLVTPGWQITRWIRKGKTCKKCGETNNLHLHHVNYPFFWLWYKLFWLSLVVWCFTEYGMWMFVILMIVPDLISRMKTLCARCHRLEHGR